MPVPMKAYFKPYLEPELAKPWKVLDLCKAYSWPTGLPAGGMVGIVELGGALNLDDVKAFCAANNVPEPTIDNATSPFPSDPQGADVEIALDVQVVAASYFAATGQPAHIRMYWPPNDDIAGGVRQAAADGCATVSISWGADEANWGGPALDDMEAAATEAAAAGTAVFAASGDNDSSDGGPGKANVDAPASCPHVVGCGGTEKRESAASPEHEEVVWNHQPGKAHGEGTGGGFSTHFPQQTWQNGAPHGSGRMVPDMAADADPRTGYEIISGGQPVVVGGTSAVAPLLAGLFAAIAVKPGFINPVVWQNHGAFFDVTKGDNGAYRAMQGPDPCTGIGRPIGTSVAALFAAPTPTS